jgi:antagonist of KipI
MAAVDVLQVIAPGILSTVQDFGRYGYGRYGVAPSGALDGFALRAANLIVGNREDEACLETTLMGLTVRALADVVVAVTGGNLQPRLNRNPLEMWRSFVIGKGDVLTFSGPATGFRAYVALGGGILVPEVLGSRSTSLFSGFGGFCGRMFQKDDILAATDPDKYLNAAGRCLQPEWIPAYPTSWTLRVLWGPQDHHFTDEGRQAFCSGPYLLSSDSDRTGIRLQGPAVYTRSDVAESIISEGVITGAIQIPGDGQPIIILGETVTGGYRKIATVISADLFLLGQMKPGDTVQFRVVSPAEAARALRKEEKRIQSFKKSLSG